MLDELREFNVATRNRASRSMRERILDRVVPKGMAVRLSRPVTRLAALMQRRKAVKLVRSCDRIHLGSGPNRLERYINIDLLGWDVDLAWDLTRPLPFNDSSVGIVFSEHVIEHLKYADVGRLMSETHRVLRTDGVLRIVVPDAGRYMRSYASGDGWLTTLRPEASTPLLAVADVIYRHGHVSAWDGHTLVRLLEEVGFREVRVTTFGSSKINPCPDLESRAAESLYVEAVR